MRRALGLAALGALLGACGATEHEGEVLVFRFASDAGAAGGALAAGGSGEAGSAAAPGGSPGAGDGGSAAGAPGAGEGGAGGGALSGGGGGAGGARIDAGSDAGSDAMADGSEGGAADAGADAPPAPGCPAGMVGIETFCIDQYEAYVVEVDAQGNESPHAPFDIVDGLTVRAKVAAGVIPQGYISQEQALAACVSAGKRLCTAPEFSLGCRGPDATNFYPYGGENHMPGACNEGKGSSVAKFFGSDPAAWTYADFNDPKLNMWDGGLAPTGSFPECKSPYGLFDCVGNLHEWGADPADAKGHGRFRGGFYGDAEVNGPGCLYVTSAHELSYHDYSTGFRCCMDAP